MVSVDYLLAQTKLVLLNKVKQPDRQITSVYCCDLLSAAMGAAPADSAWVTVMGNINVVAVSALADTACVIIADSAPIEDRALDKADEQGVIILRSELPIFETAKLVDSFL